MARCSGDIFDIEERAGALAGTFRADDEAWFSVCVVRGEPIRSQSEARRDVDAIAGEADVDPEGRRSLERGMDSKSVTRPHAASEQRSEVVRDGARFIEEGHAEALDPDRVGKRNRKAAREQPEAVLDAQDPARPVVPAAGDVAALIVRSAQARQLEEGQVAGGELAPQTDGQRVGGRVLLARIAAGVKDPGHREDAPPREGPNSADVAVLAGRGVDVPPTQPPP